jgi:hypothetical protein
MGGQLHRGGERSEIGGEAIHKAIKCRYTSGGASILFRIYFALLIPEEPALQLAPSIFPIASHGRVGRPLEVGSSTPRGRASREGFGRRRRDPRSRRGLSEATSNQAPAGFSPGGRRSVGAGSASRIPKRPGVVIRTPSSGVDGATPSNRAPLLPKWGRWASLNSCGLSEATSNQAPAGFSPGGRRSVGAGCASSLRVDRVCGSS